MPVQGKKRLTMWIILGVIIVFILIQFIPVDHSLGGPVKNEPKWDSEKTRQYAVRACFDCHSNQTRWPAYSYVAPVSWFVAGHVHDARKRVNFSEWKFTTRRAKKIIEDIKTGEMPLDSYLLLHPDARLSDTEKQEFISGLEKTFNIKTDSLSLRK
jgi:hypothetical protein